MFKIAWRNVLRNKRRSLLSLLIIIIGVAVLFLVKGYFTATYDGLKMMSISRNGHMQIATDGYWNNMEGEERYLNKDQMDKIKEILNEREEIKGYTTELKISGILGTEQGSTIISGIGIQPGKGDSYMVTEGLNLFPGDKNRVLIGEGIKKKLNLGMDEWVSVMSTTLNGAYNAASLQISGAISMGNSDADNFYVVMPLSFAQNILNTDGVDKFIVNLTETEDTEQVIDWLNSRFEEEGLSLQIKSWSDLAIFYHQVKGMYDMMSTFLSTVIFILVFFSIMEIMSMAFFERMAELGTVRAVGTKRYQIFIQLVEEALILGIIGVIIGSFAGWGLGSLLNQLNITYTPPSMSQPVQLYFSLAIKNAYIPILIGLISTILSAVYPANKAARLNIIEMLRHV